MYCEEKENFLNELLHFYGQNYNFSKKSLQMVKNTFITKKLQSCKQVDIQTFLRMSNALQFESVLLKTLNQICIK